MSQHFYDVFVNEQLVGRARAEYPYTDTERIVEQFLERHPCTRKPVSVEICYVEDIYA